METIHRIAHLPLAQEILLLTVFLMALIIVFLFVLLCCHKLWVEYRQRRDIILRERFQIRLQQWLAGTLPHPGRPRRHCEFLAWSDVLEEARAAKGNEVRARLKEAARLLSLDRHFCVHAGHVSWLTRFVAIEKLGLLRLPELKEFYRSQLKKEADRRVLAKVVWALSCLADPEVPQLINPVLADSSLLSGKFGEFIYGTLIASFREQGKEPELLALLERIGSDPMTPLPLKKAVVEACGTSAFSPAAALVRNLYHGLHRDPELRIACIRVMETLHDTEACPLIREELADPDWRVRAVAAKGAVFCADGLVGILRQALADPNYYVRMNAAATLVKLGDSGVEVLRAASRLEDRFAADAARYALRGVSC